MTVRTINVANANADRYLHELRGAYAGIRVWDPDFALQRDPWIYEKMLRDPVIRQCVGDRVRSIAGGGWSIAPARNPSEEDEEAAKIMEMAISEIRRGFQSARISLAKFIFHGTRHAYVEGKRAMRAFGDETEREWWIPTALADIDKRRIRVWREGGEIQRKIEHILGDDGVTWEREDFPMDRVITAVYEDEEGRLGFGRGLGDSCYWPFWIKWLMLDESVEARRKWARGVAVVGTDATVLGDTSQDSETVRDLLISAVKEAEGGGVIAKGLSDTIEYIHGTGEDPKVLLEVIQRCDDWIRTLLSGSKLPTGGGNDSTGSLARAEVEQDTSEGIGQLDSDVLDDAVTNGLIRAVWVRNTENLISLGLDEARMPYFRSQDEKKEDHEKNATIVTSLLTAGLELKKDEAYEKVGMTPPTDEDRENDNVLTGGMDPFGGGPLAPGAPGGNGEVEGAQTEDPFEGLTAEFAKQPKR